MATLESSPVAGKWTRRDFSNNCQIANSGPADAQTTPQESRGMYPYLGIYFSLLPRQLADLILFIHSTLFGTFNGVSYCSFIHPSIHPAKRDDT